MVKVAPEAVDRYAMYGVCIGDMGNVVCVDRGCIVLSNPCWTSYVLQPIEDFRE